MNEYKDISIKKVLILAAIEFAVAVGLSLFFSDPTPIILGIVFGFILSLLNLRLLYLTLAKAIKMPARKAQTYTSVQYGIRHIIVGICIFISIKAPYINVLGTIVGLFIVKSAIILWSLGNSVGLFQKGLIRRR